MIKTYLTDKINIVSSATDEWGVVNQSTQTNISARVEKANKMIRNQEGKEVVGIGPILIDGDAIIKPTDLLQFVSISGIVQADAGKKHQIISLEREHSFFWSYWVAYLGGAR